MARLSFNAITYRLELNLSLCKQIPYLKYCGFHHDAISKPENDMQTFLVYFFTSSHICNQDFKVERHMIYFDDYGLSEMISYSQVQLICEDGAHSPFL